MSKERQGLPIAVESNKVIALTLLKSIGSNAVRFARTRAEEAGRLLGAWSQPVDGSEDDPFTTYDSINRSELDNTKELAL